MSELREGERTATCERVELTGSDGVAVPAIHAVPETSAAAGLVLHPDMGGIRPLFDDLSRRLATHDFAVCCPEPFARAPSSVRTVSDRMASVRELDDDVQMDDLHRAADFLLERDGVDTVHVVGFCMGGMQTLKAAATGVFSRAVPFYGMIRLPEDWRGPKVHEPLATAAEVCPTLAFFGGQDPFTPPVDIAALRAAWADRPDCEIVVFPEAEHGFVHAPNRDAHRPADAADAWTRTLAWLQP